MSSARALLPDQQGQPRKQEVSAHIIDYVDLAGIEPGLERTERHVQLEYSRLSFSRVHVVQLQQGTLVGFGFTLKKRDVAQQPDAGLGVFTARRPRALRRIRPTRTRRIVHLIVEKQMLRGGENVRDVRDNLGTVVNQRIQVRT